MFSFTKGAAALAAVSLVALTAPAAAATYVYTFTGTIDTVDGAAGSGAFSATVTFDDALLDPSQPDFDTFSSFPRFTINSVTVPAGYGFAYDGLVDFQQLRGSYGPFGYYDLTDERSTITSGGAGSSILTQYSLSISGFDNVVPLAGSTLPDFARAGGGTFRLLRSVTGTDGQGNVLLSQSLELSGTLASAVPDPATWMTMLLGFSLVGGLARRRAARTLRA